MATEAAVARERLWTGPLLAFLLAVGSVVGFAVATRHPTPDLEGAIELLADGDLDGDERERMLLRLKDLASSAETARGRWAGLLAAVAIGDRQAFDELDRALGEGADRAPPAGRRHWLDLGDPLLANVSTALLAEAEGAGDVALAAWRQVAAQARMTGNRLAAGLAAARLD